MAAGWKSPQFIALSYGWGRAEPPVGGPYAVDAGQIYSPGAAVGMIYAPGAEAGEIYTPGAEAGEVFSE